MALLQFIRPRGDEIAEVVLLSSGFLRVYVELPRETLESIDEIAEAAGEDTVDRLFRLVIRRYLGPGSMVSRNVSRSSRSSM